jgi:hypothetical protein
VQPKENLLHHAMEKTGEGSNFRQELCGRPGVKIYTTDISGSSGYRLIYRLLTEHLPATPNTSGVMAFNLSVNPNLTLHRRARFWNQEAATKWVDIHIIVSVSRTAKRNV